MRLKDLFTVPTGEKVTEKHLNRVLLSSICGLLLCMACLVGTTWAWFADSIVNEGNVIQIGIPQVVLQVNGADVEDGGALKAGTYAITVTHGNEADSLAQKSNLFVTFTISNTQKVVSQYAMLDATNGYAAQISLQLDGEYAFSWNTTWATPAGVDPVTDQTIVVTADQPSSDPPMVEQPGTDDPAQQPGGDPPAVEQPGADDPVQQPSEPAEGENGNQTDTETETNGEANGESNGETGNDDGGEPTTEQETT